MSPVPSASSVLQVLSKSRLAELARELGVALASSQTKDAQIEALAGPAGAALSRLVHLLGEGIDRFFALNAERAEKERLLGRGPTRGGSSGKKSKSTKTDQLGLKLD